MFEVARTLALVSWVVGAAGTALAADDDAPPAVGLDRLLKVPDAVYVADDRRGGATKSEWRARFEAARAEREEAERRLDAVRAKIEEKAGESGAWQLSAPGSAPSTDTGPVSYQLANEMRHQREAVAAAERQLRELRVQANLAGVPADWIDPEPDAGTRP